MYPMKLIPIYKDYLWGGNKLNKVFGKESGFEITAESWELSCHKDGLCRIENGHHQGKTLASVIEENPQYVRKDYHRGDNFPMMVKLIDAAKDLSVQVHPSDETARKDLGESGKAEMWYIVKAEPRSYIYWGFNKRVTQGEIMEKAKTGEICDVMNKVFVNAGDVFYILPGTIHAIGRGCLIAEVQQSSNTTFRIYDYNRTDDKGNKRPLHLERAVAVLDYEPIVTNRVANNSGVLTDNFSLSNIFECEYLKVSKIECKKDVSLFCGENSFYSMLFISGEGQMIYRDKTYTFRAGDSFFLPAGMGKVKIEGTFTALLSSL